MSRHRERDIYARTLRKDQSDDNRFADIAIEFIDDEDDSTILSLGGVWDKKFKRWTDKRPKTTMSFRIHKGQRPAMDFFVKWLEAYAAGDDLEIAIYSVLLFGGSRSGKTNLGVRIMIAFSIMVPMSRVWAIAETETAFDEMQSDLEEILPDEWFDKKDNRYKTPHGTTIWLRSGMHPHKLKRGRCDFAFLNEGQNVKRLSHDMLRMRTSDTGGLVVTAANPPNDNPDGAWIADWIEEDKAGRRPHAMVFELSPLDNPYVNREQLEALREETDHRTYEIEVLGKVLPPSNACYHAFDVFENVDQVPDMGDITAEYFARIGMGNNVKAGVGLDFQRTPHMAGVLGRLFRNPQDEARPLIYFEQAMIVDMGDEYDLSDALYAAGLRPETTVLIGDASGDWQDADRTKGGASFDVLRECGWNRIYTPDRKSRKNPPILERIKNDNRLFATESGSHIVRIDPAAKALIEAVKKWPKGPNGLPSRNSKYAHICDAMSYFNWRVFPRRTYDEKLGYKRLKGRQRASMLRRI